jgi:autotransporter-associated beta strand protein
VIAGTAMAVVRTAHATGKPFTWNGSVTGGAWSAGGNWTAGSGGNPPPGSGDTAVFSTVTGSSSTTPTIGSTATTVGSIQYSPAAQSFTIGGTAILTISANGVQPGGTIGVQLLSGSANQTINAPIALGASQTWDIQANTLTVSGVVSESGGSRSLTKTGGGTLTLSGNNTYSGGTTLTGGAITLGADNALGASTSSLNFNGGTLNANNHHISIGALSLTASSTLNLVNDSSGVSLVFSSASATGGTLTINGWQNNSTRDEIIITSQPSAAFLNEVQFTGFAAGATWIAATGELVPTGFTPVPEPINLALGFFALIGIASKVASWRLQARGTRRLLSLT